MKNTKIVKQARIAFTHGVDTPAKTDLRWSWNYELSAFRAGAGTCIFGEIDVESTFKEWIKSYFKMNIDLWEEHCEQAAEIAEIVKDAAKSDNEENLARLTEIKEGSSEFKTKCLNSYNDGLSIIPPHDNQSVLGRILRQAYDAGAGGGCFYRWWDCLMDTSKSARKFHTSNTKLPDTSVDISEALKDAADDQQFKFVCFVYKGTEYFVSEAHQAKVIGYLASKTLDDNYPCEINLLRTCDYALSDAGKVIKNRYEHDTPKNFYPAIITAKEWNHDGA